MANHNHTCGASHCRRHGKSRRKKQIELNNETNVKPEFLTLERKSVYLEVSIDATCREYLYADESRIAFDPNPHATLRVGIR